MTSFFKSTIAVKLVDDATGDVLATSDVPLADLPDSFALQTTLEIAGRPHVVVRAEPADKVQFARAGSLTLHLRAVDTTSPRDILFSLPTLCGAALPEAAPGAVAGGVMAIHEDDFRQCELVSSSYSADITAELLAIQEVYSNASSGPGWTRLHLRERIPRPLPPGLAWKAVLGRLGRVDPLGGIALGNPKNLIRGAVAASMRNGTVVWGVETNGELSVLCLQNPGLAAPQTVSALRRLSDELSLAIVDWCRCRVYCSATRIEGALGDPWDEVQ